MLSDIQIAESCKLKDIREIASKLGCNGFELLAELSSLEVKGLICRLGGNRYSTL